MQREKKYTVKLKRQEREELLTIVKKGKSTAKKITHARILLQADSAGKRKQRSDKEIGEILNIGERTVSRVRQRYAEEGLTAALNRRAHSQYKPRKLTGEQEAQLIALTCSEPPEGRTRWTVKLLTSKLIELEVVEDIGKTTVHKTLKKMNLSLG